MRRLALLLAASVLGTGCIVTTDDTCAYRTVSVDWQSFLLADGGTTTSCTTAGVRWVDVYMDDALVDRFDCTDRGVSVVDVPAGTHRFTVEGIDLGGNIVLRAERSAFGSPCGEQFLPTQPAEGIVTLDYAFVPANVCTEGGSYMWFSIQDEILGVVTAVADESANTTRYACGNAISFAMPAGPYTLQRIEEVVWSGTDYLPTASNCGAAAFDVGGAQESIVVVDLSDTNSFCPAAAAKTSRSANPRAKVTAKVTAAPE